MEPGSPTPYVDTWRENFRQFQQTEKTCAEDGCNEPFIGTHYRLYCDYHRLEHKRESDRIWYENRGRQMRGIIV